jgi:DNA-directed RNA polymerase specialized sigma24 family protein
MSLARRADPDLDVGTVPAPGASLPADPGLEEMFATLYTQLVPVAVDHACRFLSQSQARDAVGDAMAEVWARWKKLLPE